MNEKLFNPDYLLHLCQKYDLRPSKKYGQNYLINSEVIDTMVAAAEVGDSDTIVEVGPGFGTLTFALSEQAKKVIAFEIEKKIAPYWEEILKRVQNDSGSDNKNNIEIIWGNVLQQADETSLPAKKYKVVANLPYQITSQIIRYFLECKNPPVTMTIMVQKEVGERICAAPGDLSVLALAVQYYAEPEMVGVVKSNNFWPEPQVNSAIIRLKVKKNIKFSGSQDFFDLIKKGFAQKRKFLIKNLVGYYDKNLLMAAFTKFGISTTARAQELSLQQWLELAGEIKAGQ